MLAQEMRRVLARVDAHAGIRSNADQPESASRPKGSGGEQIGEHVGRGSVGALDALCACFGLTGFEREVLVLVAAMELDPSTSGRCAAASGLGYPSFGLALAALADSHWDALPPSAPLRRWDLVHLGRSDEGGGLTSSPLRIDERILHFLIGVSYLDERLRGLVRPVTERVGPLPPTHRRVAEALATGWQAHFDLPADQPSVVELTGADAPTRREIASAAAVSAGLALFEVAEADLPTEPVERDRLARLWQREAILLNAALLIQTGEAAPSSNPFSGPRTALGWMLGALSVPVLLAGDEPVPDPSGRPPLRLTVPVLPASEQRELWAGALNGVVADGSADDLGRLVAQFSLPAHAIRTAAASVRRDQERDQNHDQVGAAGTRPAEVARLARLTWQAGLAQARLALDELGRRIEPRAGWDDLVLPPAQLRTLHEITAHVRQRSVVHQDWGFDEVLRRGLGVTALFAGGSGTGKTLAAEVIAKELGLDLFVIDLSQVVSKYIGETEKNLRRVFDAAERGGAVLLFDEADALFGKRSEVKDSHDRYANIEVSYLLMRMEAYRGLAVLTSNLRQALDTAFLRRLRFVVEFPFPGADERAQIWRRVIPERAPTQGLDPVRLAQLGVAGGGIRNIALSAAFLAADEAEPMQMRHVLAAAQTELLKTERAPTPTEVAGWL
jgi:hypothetical protein